MLYCCDRTTTTNLELRTSCREYVLYMQPWRPRETVTQEVYPPFNSIVPGQEHIAFIKVLNDGTMPQSIFYIHLGDGPWSVGSGHKEVPAPLKIKNSKNKHC
jgi:hypothetical protein